MLKLHVKIKGVWLPVFCCSNTPNIVTCENTPHKALPSHSMWADDDLLYFMNKFGNNEFKLISIKR